MILLSPELSKVGFKPSYLTTSLDPAKNDMIVLFPTPVSPITMTASEFYLSMGIASTPALIKVFSLGRSMGLESNMEFFWMFLYEFINKFLKVVSLILY